MVDIKDELPDDFDLQCAAEIDVLEELLAKNQRMKCANSRSKNQAAADADLFATLCEIDKFNYMYLFERCKAFHINARQLRFMESEHIRRIIPSEQAGVLAEFEQLHLLWKQKCLQTVATVRNNKLRIPTKVAESPITRIVPSTTEPTCKEIITDSSEESSDADYCYFEHLQKATKFSLDYIIKDEMLETRKQYKKHGTLTERNRRRLAKVIVCYFLNNNIYFKKDIMDNIADQIVADFPTESKLAWHDMRTTQRRGRLCLKLYNMQRTRNSYLKRHRKIEDDEMEELASLKAKSTDRDTTDSRESVELEDLPSETTSMHRS